MTVFVLNAMKIVAMDPATNQFGISTVTLNGDVLELTNSLLIVTPEGFSADQKICFAAHMAAAYTMIEQPTDVVSERPWGMGNSKEQISQLMGAIKAELWCKIKWQTVSEARLRAVGYGAASKDDSARGILKYNWDRKSKNAIQRLIDAANPEKDTGYDILDSIMHAVAYLVGEPPKPNKRR